jgi:hypothetical protein
VHDGIHAVDQGFRLPILLEGARNEFEFRFYWRAPGEADAIFPGKIPGQASRQAAAARSNQHPRPVLCARRLRCQGRSGRGASA